ncbi:MAG: hypothetical protein M3R15_03640 [Acidobacteriota bacterium]|nr:hypothetical protein [Acidobacteriota bacterium]
MMVKMHGNMPSKPLKPPANRHYIAKVTEKSWTKAENTVIEPWVDVKADVAAVNAGEAIRTGNLFEINGRTYGVESNGTLYPISGSGFHSLDRKAYNALKLYRKFGDTLRVAEIPDNMGVDSAQREAALKAWKAGGGK